MCLYKYRQLGYFIGRLVMFLAKLVLIVIGISILCMVFFKGYSVLIDNLDIKSRLENRIELDSVPYGNGNHGKSADNDSVLAIAVTTLLTVVTILQAHYTRLLGRVFNFTNAEVTKVLVGMDQANNVYQVEKYFSAYEGMLIIELEYAETFSTFYECVPVVAYVKLNRRGENPSELVEKVRIYQYIHYHKNGKQYLLMETEYSKLLSRFNKTRENKEDKLTIWVDFCWSNCLLPFMLKGMSDLYVREQIELVENKNTYKDCIYDIRYQVQHTRHSYIPLMHTDTLCVSMHKLIKRYRRKKDVESLKKSLSNQ